MYMVFVKVKCTWYYNCQVSVSVHGIIIVKVSVSVHGIIIVKVSVNVHGI